MTAFLRTRNTDMWAILSAEAEGEAAEKLESCTHGGTLGILKGALVVYQVDKPWSQHETCAIRQLPNCNHKHEISAATERWEEKYRPRRPRKMERPDSWKMTALKMMLRGENQTSAEYRVKELKT